MRLPGVLLIALLASAPVAQAQENGPVGVVRAFHAALAAGDSATVLELLAPDAVIFEAGGVEASREEYRSHHLPADMAFTQAVTREVTQERFGVEGDVAWVLSESRTLGTYRDRSVDSLGAETMILRRTTAGWRIVHIHWSSRRVGGG